MGYSMVYPPKALLNLVQYVFEQNVFVEDKIVSFWLLQPYPVSGRKYHTKSCTSIQFPHVIFVNH